LATHGFAKFKAITNCWFAGLGERLIIGAIEGLLPTEEITAKELYFA
jgi:hypothetical protein